MTFPGPKCSICYTIFSIWGIITLFILGGLFDVNYYPVDQDEVNDHHGAAVNSFIAGAVYVGCAFGCFARFMWLRRKLAQEQPPKFDFGEA